MNIARRKGFVTAVTAVAAAALLLTGCGGSNDPLAQETADQEAGGAVVIGSQAYYSNTIIAEIYAQALEKAGFEVERRFDIGQRDAYMPSLENGELTLFPEYTGNLLQWYDPETTVRQPEEVYTALTEALPEGLSALQPASATDQDSYTVTGAFAQEHNLKTIGDLANAGVPLTLGGPPELAERPYGPNGLKEVYGVDVAFQGTGDTTVDELVAGTVNVANVYTSDPRIQTDGLVTLEDPEGLFLSSQVVPIVNSARADELASVIDPISAKLTPEGLIALNVQSTVDQKSPGDIASAWLSENGFA